MTVDRGEIYWFDLPEADDEDETVTGREQAEQRPGIVLQNDSYNQNIDTTVIVPLTTGSTDDARYNSTVFISSGDECVSEDSIALCTQLRVVDFEERESGQLGELSSSKLREVEMGVQDVLDMF